MGAGLAGGFFVGCLRLPPGGWRFFGQAQVMLKRQERLSS